MGMRLASFAFLLCLVLACANTETARTEVLVVVDSDLQVPSELDEIEFHVRGPDGSTRDAVARFGPSDPGLPRSLALVHDGGELAPLDVVVRGRHEGALVLDREARLGFVRGRTLVLPMHLVRSCLDKDCGNQTCTEHGCAPVDVDPNALPSWSGEEPRLGDTTQDGDTQDAGPSASGMDASTRDAGTASPDAGRVTTRDAGGSMQPADGGSPMGTRDAGGSTKDAGETTGTPDAGGSTPPPDAGGMMGTPDAGGSTHPPDAGMCIPQPEICNQRDDDCDGTVDDGFDLLSDENHCGSCGKRCNNGANRTCCSGVCKKSCGGTKPDSSYTTYQGALREPFRYDGRRWHATTRD